MTDALIKAIQTGNVEELTTLIKAGYNVNASSFWNTTDSNPLYQAVEYGQLECVKVLVAAGANVNFTSFSGYTPLHGAVINGNSEIVKFLLEHGAQANLASVADFFDYSPLTFAVEFGNIPVANILLEYGANVNSLSGLTRHSTPLTYAVENEDIAMVKFLLENGANVNTFVSSEETPLIADAYASSSLFLATLSQNQEILSLLVEAGANDLAWSPLHHAIATQDFDQAYALLAQDPSLVHAKDIVGLSPLHYALLDNNIPLLDSLAHHGADTDLSASPISLLNEAALLPSISIDVFEWAIQHTDNINAINNDGDTVLHTVVNTHQPEKIDLLIKAGADLHIKDASGHTPYELAQKIHDLPADLVLKLNPDNQITLDGKEILFQNDGFAFDVAPEGSHSNHHSMPTIVTLSDPLESIPTDVDQF